MKIFNPHCLLIFIAERIDYRAPDVVLMFEECIKRKCVNITITEDQTNEFDESFTFHLNSSTNFGFHFNFGSVEGVIHIIDNDGEKQIIV